MIAVLALYAFVLQAFLGGLMPMPAAADGICAQHSADGSDFGKAVPHGHGDCCTAAQVAGTALPPREAPSAVAWIAPAHACAGFGQPAEPGARPPPGGGTSPRGPPTA
ncbi:hypothetical protein MKK69_11040 [Methylobacterium sp. J-026]|nr:hypothetical protein [Methylobacterium sp. J-026]